MTLTDALVHEIDECSGDDGRITAVMVATSFINAVTAIGTTISQLPTNLYRIFMEFNGQSPHTACLSSDVIRRVRSA